MAIWDACLALPPSVSTLRDDDVPQLGSWLSFLPALQQGTPDAIFQNAIQLPDSGEIYLNGVLDDTGPSALSEQTMGSSICVSIGKAYFQRSGASGEGSADILVYLNVYADPNTPAARWIKGRSYTRSFNLADQ